MSSLNLLILLLVAVIVSFSCAFTPQVRAGVGARAGAGAAGAKSVGRGADRFVRMEYVPDGLTKAQWEQLKKREEEELKKKGNLGALGATKFKSRSFEAWQKAGAKHLFPTNPKATPYEERPYMQRKGGDWEGKDLSKIGLAGAGQGEASKRLEVDNVYDGYKAQGKLDSASFFGGVSLPWTNEAANKMNNSKKEAGVQGPRGVAGKQLSQQEMAALKANLVKPVFKETLKKQQAPDAPAATSEPKKKMFGLF